MPDGSAWLLSLLIFMVNQVDLQEQEHSPRLRSTYWSCHTVLTC